MIRQALRTRLRGTMIWAAAFVFMIIGGMTKFDTFESGGVNDLNQMVQAFPRVLRVMYGMEGKDLSTFTGYFSILLLYVLMMLAVHGAFLGGSLMLWEFKDRTADFLLTKPMSRTHVLVRKLIAGLIVMGVLQAVIALSCMYVFAESDQLAALPQTILMTTGLHLFFFAVGFCLTLLMKEPRHAQVLSLIVVLIGYFGIILGQLYDITAITYITPLGWAQARAYDASTPELLGGVGLMALCALGLIWLGIARFQRRDIPA